ncbi:MAG TPA: lipopolysaccharide heptosyltransferase II [bacterium]|nr:lipopolysaccharide heptosyltransferase II [bacterium]
MPVLPETKKNLRILVTRADRIGDLVLSTPVFQALREKFPQSRIACLTFCENREIVEGNPHLDEVILYDKKGSVKGVWGNLLFAWKLRRKNFDAVIHLHATNRMHWVGWLAGIPVRMGYSRKCAWALTQAIPDLKSEGKKHEAEYNFDLLKPLGVDAPPKLEPFFPLQEKSEKSLEELCRRLEIPQGKPWIILSPSASCPSKIWPAERFGELADAIAARHDVTFLAIGSFKDRPFVEKAAQSASVPIHDLSGRLSLGMLGHLLSRVSLLISNDSGPVHIARAVGTPVISIFGRNQPGLSPARWRPLGEDSRVVWKDVGCAVCLAHNCEIGFLCLDAISVDDVLREVDSFAMEFKNRRNA